MLEAVQQPLGHTIHDIYRRNLFKKSRKKVWWAPAKEEVDGLVEELIRTLSDNGIEAVAEDLKGKVFALRVRLFELLTSHDAFSLTQRLLQQDIEHKELKLELGSFHGAEKGMVESYLQAFRTYLKIVQGSADRIGWKTITQANEETRPSGSFSGYEEFRDSFLNTVPHPWGQAFLAFLDASLAFEIGVISSELALNREIRLPNKEKKAVSDLLFRSVEEMGVNASYLGIWEPDEGDEEQIVRNIKVRNAKVNAQNKEKQGYTIEELKKELDQGPST